MQRTAGQALLEGVLVDWVQIQPTVEPQLPVSWLSLEESAAELVGIQRSRAQQTAREAELILRIAELSPDDGDLPPEAPGARRDWRTTEPPFPGVSEFFPDQVAHAINLGRGTRSSGRGGRSPGAITYRPRSPS